MSVSMNRRHALGALVATTAGTFLPRPGAAGEEPLALITAANAAVTSLSKSELKRLFLGEPVSVGGQKLVPFNLPPTTKERQRFDTVMLGFNADQVTKYWIDRRIRGQGNPPRTVPTPEVLVQVAAKFAGAVAYVPMRLANNPTIKTIDIEGMKPTDAGYPLGNV